MLTGNVVEPPRRESCPEVPHAGHDDPRNGHADVGPGLIQHQELHAPGFDERAALLHVFARVGRFDRRIP